MKQVAPHIARIRAGYAGKYTGQREPTLPKVRSKCCQADVILDDRETVCTNCWQPCLIEYLDPPPDRMDRTYERARARGWED